MDFYLDFLNTTWVGYRSLKTGNYQSFKPNTRMTVREIREGQYVYGRQKVVEAFEAWASKQQVDKLVPYHEQEKVFEITNAIVRSALACNISVYNPILNLLLHHELVKRGIECKLIEEPKGHYCVSYHVGVINPAEELMYLTSLFNVFPVEFEPHYYKMYQKDPKSFFDFYKSKHPWSTPLFE